MVQRLKVISNLRPGNALLQLDALASVLADLVRELDDAGYGLHLCLLASTKAGFLQPSFTSSDKE